jgi:hypothetical protein
MAAAVTVWVCNAHNVPVPALTMLEPEASRVAQPSGLARGQRRQNGNDPVDTDNIEPGRPMNRAVAAQPGSALAAVGSNQSQILSATFWLIDPLTDTNGAWEEWVRPGCSPAGATAAAQLAGPTYRVRMGALARSCAIPTGTGHR